MGAQIHTKFMNDQVKELMQKYLNKEVARARAATPAIGVRIEITVSAKK